MTYNRGILQATPRRDQNITFYQPENNEFQSTSFQQLRIVKFVQGLPLPKQLTEMIVDKFQREVQVDQP